MLKNLIAALVLAVLAGSAVFWFATMPKRLSAAEIDSAAAGDAIRGERMFFAGGCASCHARPDAPAEAALELAGGISLESPFGTFVAPNISQHAEDGIGAWSFADFANAMKRGVSPDGRHYYPAFPYTSYARMEMSDIADLYAFMTTLPAVQGDAPGHEVGFPFNISRGIGLWKLLHLSPEPVLALAGASDEARAGQYLVEGPGHCGECHTPRAFTGGLDKDQWLAGAVAAEGDGVVPNITSGEGGIGDWSEDDIAYFLESGFTPDFDSVGGDMAEVQRNLSMLPAEDRAAIAAYLKAIPAHPNGYPAKER